VHVKGRSSSAAQDDISSDCTINLEIWYEIPDPVIDCAFFVNLDQVILTG